MTSSDLPKPEVTISVSSSIFTAGFNFVLTCTVTLVEYLTVKPTVQWNGGSVGSGNGVMVGDTNHSGVMSMRTLTFSVIFNLEELNEMSTLSVNLVPAYTVSE